MRMRAAGFSLLEMLLVLVLIAAAMLLAMAAFGDGMRGVRLHAAATELAAQLRFTRAVAIASGTPQDFTIDPSARHWQAAKGRHGQLPEIGELVFAGARAQQFNADPRMAGLGLVRFFPDGAATGGRVRLAANGGGWDVDVAWLTGEVRVHRIGGTP